MSTPSDSPAPGSAPKPAFKVTRSPYTPKISGTATTGPMTGPLSLGALGPAPAPRAPGTMSDAPGPVPGSRLPKPGARKFAKRSSASDDTTAVGLVVDLLAAGASLTCAALLAHGLGYF